MNAALRMLDEVGNRLAGADLRLAVLALLAHLANHVLRSVAWRGVLAAAYPRERVRLLPVLSGYAAGVALNAVTPARGGDAVKVGLVRTAIPGSTFTTIAATLSVLVALDLVIGTLLVLTVGLTGAVPLDLGAGVGRVTTAAPIIAAVILVVTVAGFLFRGRLRALAARLRQGGAVLRTPARYLVAVALPQLAAWCCRVCVVLCLLAAFGLPATVAVAALVMVVGGASTVIPLTPGGAGTQQVLLAVALSKTASAAAVVSFSLAMQASVTVVNAAIGLAAAMTVCRSVRPVRAVRSAFAGARA
ncbi:lysylphosphatidylglycerol synthase domain-containing protein [Solirubrobacter soli]|uniref:lysylphosphatidylglycerol synthase domain-containing protein n=1 Tax=Solirubrobacter soli TaxID=363832 RepID=UPI000420B59E|nr:lysylphosphatidylglycerol synthase domain-containing protein [Solirubrobacter soli]